MDDSRESGAESSEIGDAGEGLVAQELKVARAAVAELVPDLGEDFLVEIDGRRAASTGAAPRVIWIQVKAHKAACAEDVWTEPKVREKHLHRWAGHVGPVLLVVVHGAFERGKQTFYTREIDDFLRERPEVLDSSRPQGTYSVKTHRTDDLAAAIRNAAEAFLRATRLELAALSPEEVEDNHFEPLSSPIPCHTGYLPGACFERELLWKSSDRPYSLGLIASELARQMREQHADAARPMEERFFLYRSKARRNGGTVAATLVWRQVMHEQAELVEPWKGKFELEVLRPDPLDQVFQLVSRGGEYLGAGQCDWALASLQAAEQGPLRFVDADDKEEAELVVSTALLLARARQIVANGQVETAIAKDVHPSQLREAIALLNQARQRLESVYEDPSEADSDLEFFWLEVELWCINLELVRRQLSGSKAPSGALGAKRLELLRSQAKLVDEWAREQARAAGNIAQREAWAIRLHELPGMSAAQQRIAILAQRDPSILESPKTLQREMAVWLAPLAHLHDQALKDFFADEESAAGFKQHFISEVRRLEALSCSATVLSVFRRARRGGMEDPALVDQTHAAYLQAGAELMASGIMCSIADNATTRELEAHRLLAGLRRAVVKGYGVLLQTLATLGLPEEEAGAVFALSPLDTLKMGASPHHPELDLLLRRPWVALALADASGRVDVDENGTSIWAEPETARHVLKLPGLLEMIDQAFDELTEVFLAHCYFPVALADGILASELTDAPDVGELADKLDLQPS